MTVSDVAVRLKVSDSFVRADRRRLAASLPAGLRPGRNSRERGSPPGIPGCAGTGRAAGATCPKEAVSEAQAPDLARLLAADGLLGRLSKVLRVFGEVLVDL